MNKLAQDFDINARYPAGPSYQDILDRDTREVPAFLRAQSAPFLGTEPIPASNYTSQAFFDLEAEKMWMRVWQMACREEEIPNVGDYLLYEIVGKSVLIVRSAPDTIKAYYNACLHRGRKLATEDGCKKLFRCPFHGFTWNLDGTLNHHPFPWDFQHLTDDDLKLPELQVGTWGGFVFVNFDRNAPELKKVLGPLVQHMERANLENRYIGQHVAKVVKANWKVVSEAFMESHHTIDTHPQIMSYLADANSQYDVYSDYITRQISAVGVASPHLRETVSEQRIVDSMFEQSSRMDGAKKHILPEGMKARAFLAQLLRDQFKENDGNDYDHYSDAEILDAILYNIFPNVSIWPSISQPLVYRWRPNGRDPNSAIMEVYRLFQVPKGKPRPAPAKVNFLRDDQVWTDATELGSLADVFMQDEENLPYVQEGLHSSGNNRVEFGNYQEMRLRQHHIMLNRYINDQI